AAPDRDLVALSLQRWRAEAKVVAEAEGAGTGTALATAEDPSHGTETGARRIARTAVDEVVGHSIIITTMVSARGNAIELATAIGAEIATEIVGADLGEKIREAEKTALKLDPTHAKLRRDAVAKEEAERAQAQGEAIVKAIDAKFNEFIAGQRALVGEKRILTSLQRRHAAAEMGHFAQLTTGTLEEFQTACEGRWANREFLKLIHRLFETYKPDVKPPRYKGERILAAFDILRTAQ
ncbi:unnamed protein product, partial [Prorocentrum cordatum]